MSAWDTVPWSMAAADVADLVPEQIAFSDLAFPTMPSSSLAAPHTSFSSFLQNINRRTAKRTPKLDRVLVAIEKAAAEIRADSHGLPQGMYAEYTESARHMLQDLAKSLERLLADVAKPGGQDGETLAEQPVAAEMFVGRVALYLGSTSSFLSDIKGGTELVSGESVNVPSPDRSLTSARYLRSGHGQSTCSIDDQMEGAGHRRGLAEAEPTIRWTSRPVGRPSVMAG